VLENAGVSRVQGIAGKSVIPGKIRGRVVGAVDVVVLEHGRNVVVATARDLGLRRRLRLGFRLRFRLWRRLGLGRRLRLGLRSGRRRRRRRGRRSRGSRRSWRRRRGRRGCAAGGGRLGSLSKDHTSGLVASRDSDRDDLDDPVRDIGALLDIANTDGASCG
jgi:hypothetical protein